MAGQFVAVLDDAAGDPGIALGHPAQGEEGGLDTMLVEHAQDAVHVRLHPAGPMRPFVPRDAVGEGGDLEIVFHVDGHHVA